ncbi:protein SAMBA-like isoform X1 [Zingiber officinale]|uniref:protein SAMBA-like isoform X1 n=1 Tax=Zingiber officinale TaxID=94328 RepID=UPI001C4CEF58|nr:protein SAMBA-like isoform X1 [Zingiber officinale]
MSSPARSSVSATSVGQGCGVGGFVDESPGPYQLPPDAIFSAYERKDEALAALKSELMEALQKEVKSLDEDAWMFAGPRSQIQRISRPDTTLEFIHRTSVTIRDAKGL